MQILYKGEQKGEKILKENLLKNLSLLFDMYFDDYDYY
jgi:hypothetical protein